MDHKFGDLLDLRVKAKYQTRILDNMSSMSLVSFYQNKNIAEGTRGPFYTIGRSSLPAAETLRRRRRKKKT